jgi:hypothetical protein
VRKTAAAAAVEGKQRSATRSTSRRKIQDTEPVEAEHVVKKPRLTSPDHQHAAETTKQPEHVEEPASAPMVTELVPDVNADDMDKWDEDDDFDRPVVRPKRETVARECPYLDTIDRHRLDFDFEKVCSISLSNINVYACLVCGRYFQGTPDAH